MYFFGTIIATGSYLHSASGHGHGKGHKVSPSIRSVAAHPPTRQRAHPSHCQHVNTLGAQSFFEGYTILPMLLVLFQAFHGLAVALVYKCGSLGRWRLRLVGPTATPFRLLMFASPPCVHSDHTMWIEFDTVWCSYGQVCRCDRQEFCEFICDGVPHRHLSVFLPVADHAAFLARHHHCARHHVLLHEHRGAACGQLTTADKGISRKGAFA